jgi:site-specific DNA-methyltransferase (adenine-specific)
MPQVFPSVTMALSFGGDMVAINKFQLMQGDCLELMKQLSDASVDLILCDLPYGTTSCAWDGIIPFGALWAEYRRVAKPNAAIVLTASQPFTTALIASNMREFRYCWTWKKNRATGFANAKKQPLRQVEDVVVFYRAQPTYNPQGLVRINKTRKNSTQGGQTIQGSAVGSAKGGLRTIGAEYVQEFTGYPTAFLEFQSERGHHPTQKPVALMEYLVRTYTNEGGTVLDNCMGSGTTGVACMNAGRRFIGMELDTEYFAIAQQRILAAIPQPANDNASCNQSAAA